VSNAWLTACRADDLRKRSRSVGFTAEFLIVDGWLQLFNKPHRQSAISIQQSAICSEEVQIR
jgi:hypothetical protein